MDRLEQAETQISGIHAQLSRAQGTTGTIITEKKLEGILDVLKLIVAEVRDLRNSKAGEDSGIAGGGIQGPFDPDERPWEK